MKRNGSLIKCCLTCTSEFKCYVSKSKQYCSLNCYKNRPQKVVARICRFCQTTFTIQSCRLTLHKNSGRYCSKKCRDSGQSKKGGVRDNKGQAAQDRIWAQAVKERDNYICQKCGSKGGHAHHIGTRSKRPDLRHVLTNGITLCTSCHAWVHHHPKEAIKMGLLSNESYKKEIIRERTALAISFKPKNGIEGSESISPIAGSTVQQRNT